MEFKIKQKDPNTRARRGAVTVRGKTFETPAFMPVGTVGTVKGAQPQEVWATGSRILLCNTYHLHLRPGEEIVAKMGGLHPFMGWEGAILTDSGGFQVFSLASLRRIDDQAVEFQSHLDGARIRLDPEGALKIQTLLGSDIAMVLDQCVQYPAEKEEVLVAVDRTALWAERSIKARSLMQEGAALFGIVQGGAFQALRERSASQITQMDFDGFAVGGLSVGEGKGLMREVLEYTTPLLPENKPHYLMGVGEPDDILDSVALGIDMFDCVLPTRNARNGTLFTRNGLLKLRNASLKDDPSPPDPECACPLCSNYSRAYIRHLFNAKEMLGPMLATLHNLRFYQDLTLGIRNALEQGNFSAFRSAFLAKYNKEKLT